MSLRHRNAIRAAAWASLAVAVAIVGGSGRAEAAAACGGQVSHRPAALDAMLRADLIEAFGPGALPDPARAPAPRPTPCSGPSCSKAPLAPTTPPHLAERDRLDRWACGSAAILPPTPAASRLAAGEIDARPVHRGMGLERPPRP